MFALIYISSLDSICNLYALDVSVSELDKL
jgi:hypothetical protein